MHYETRIYFADLLISYVSYCVQFQFIRLAIIIIITVTLVFMINFVVRNISPAA